MEHELDRNGMAGTATGIYSGFDKNEREYVSMHDEKSTHPLENAARQRNPIKGVDYDNQAVHEKVAKEFLNSMKEDEDRFSLRTQLELEREYLRGRLRTIEEILFILSPQVEDALRVQELLKKLGIKLPV